jgi:hypothetical protein
LALQRNSNAVCKSFAGLTLLLGGLTFIQYAFGINLGIDEFFKMASKSTFLNSPGRMVMNSTVAYIFASTSLILLSNRVKGGKSLSAAGFLGGIAMSFGIIAIFGDSLKLGSNINYASLLHMPTPAAICFFITGLSIFLVSLRELNLIPRERYRILPLLSSLMLTFLVLLIWQYSLKQEELQISQTVNSQSTKANELFNEKFEQTARAVTRFASRVELLGLSNPKFLILDSTNYINQIDVIKRIGITDKTFKVLWSFPEDIDFQVANYQQSSDPIRKQTFEATRYNRYPILSQIIDLKSGGKGSLMPMGLYKDKEYIGAIYVTFEVSKLFAR